ncbi:MAG: TonB family protein [Acidobacteria bacterium]|nr:TonB family protein [Acidobacteriota bacterium]
MKEVLTAVLLIVLVTANVFMVKAFEFDANLEAKATKKVAPLYPPLAKRKRVEGKVKIGIQLDSEGAVSKVEFIEGNALFKPASLEAAKQWSFSKSMAGTNGHIVFNFKLEEKE